MRNIKLLIILLTALFLPKAFCETIEPMVVHHAFDKGRFNENWKVPLATGEEAQVVMMSVSPQTNPNNEVGMENHAFDQVIFIIGGQGKVILNQKEHMVKTGDMVFVPLGTPHNVINLSKEKPLKLMSVYSQRDMPDVIFKVKEDEPI
jgi:mannose-6-phosphate isomerase-like protein (cupin superfamily)